MDKFVNWYNEHYDEICWFIIGWLAMAFLEQVGREHWVMAAIDAGLIWFNYRLWKSRR